LRIYEFKGGVNRGGETGKIVDRKEIVNVNIDLDMPLRKYSV